MATKRKGKAGKDKLTPKQEAFIGHYLANGFNASDAARKAGYSPRTAFRAGQQNMQKPAIRAAIEAKRTKMLEHIDMTAKDVVTHWVAIATADARSVWEEDGLRLKHMSKWPEHVARSVQSISVSNTDKGTTMKVQLASKISALEALAKYMRMFGDAGLEDNESKTVVVEFK